MKEENVDLSQIKPFPIEKGAELPQETQEEVNKKLKEMADRDELMKQNGINIELGSTESKSDAVADYKEKLEEKLIGPTIKPQLSEAESLSALEQVKMEEPKKEPLPVSDAPLEQVARENRKYEILKRERALTEAERSRNRSAVGVGLCLLGVAASVAFNKLDPNQVVQHELASIYSWEALISYFKDLGPLATLLGGLGAALAGKMGLYEKRIRKARLDLEDFNASLENNNELGGNENARTR